jgi:hypothetical protein
VSVARCFYSRARARAVQVTPFNVIHAEYPRENPKIRGCPEIHELL